MRWIVIEETRKVVPISVEDNLPGGTFARSHCSARSIMIVWLTLADLLHRCTKIEEEKNTQHQRDRSHRNRSDQIAEVSVFFRLRHSFAIEKWFEFFQYISAADA